MFVAQQGDDSWMTIHHDGVVEGLDAGLKQPPRRDSKRPRQRVHIVPAAVVATAAAATAAAVALMLLLLLLLLLLLMLLLGCLVA